MHVLSGRIAGRRYLACQIMMHQVFYYLCFRRTHYIYIYIYGDILSNYDKSTTLMHTYILDGWIVCTQKDAFVVTIASTTSNTMIDRIELEEMHFFRVQ